MQASTAYSTGLRAYLASHATDMFREGGNPFAYPFLAPGSVGMSATASSIALTSTSYRSILPNRSILVSHLFAL